MLEAMFQRLLTNKIMTVHIFQLEQAVWITVEQRRCLLYTRRSNMACHVKHDRQRQHDVTHAAVWDLEQAAAQRASARSKQGRQAELCQASPETGGGLGGGPFVGEVAGEDSLSFATSSSPTRTNTHSEG